MWRLWDLDKEDCKEKTAKKAAAKRLGSKEEEGAGENSTVLLL